MNSITVYCHSIGRYGIERICLNLVNQWTAQGVRVTVVVADEPGERASELDRSVKLESLRANNPWKVIAGLAAHIRAARPELVLAFNTGNGNKLLAAKYLARSRCSIAVGIHNTESKSAKLRSSWEQKILTPLGFKFLVPRADFILAVSEGVAADFVSLTGIPRERIRVIYNPVFSESLLAASQESPKHPWLEGAKRDTPVVVGAGRLIEHKDFSTFLRVVARVREEQPVRAIILGQGKLQNRLEDEAAALGLGDVVDFHGFVDNPYAYFARADLFMLTSRWEGLPTVIIEALGCGTPVVATDCPSGPSEILADRRYGRLAEMNDPEGLADAVLDLLSRPKDSDACIERAQDFSDFRIAGEYRTALGF